MKIEELRAKVAEEVFIRDIDKLSAVRWLRMAAQYGEFAYALGPSDLAYDRFVMLMELCIAAGNYRISVEYPKVIRQ